MNRVRCAIATVCLIGYCGGAAAKLPPPSPDEEAKAAQAKEKANAAAAAAEAATKRAQDRVAERYIAEMKSRGIDVHPTPVLGPATGAVTTAPGKTPPQSHTGESPERKSTDRGAKGSDQDATGADAGKASNKK